MAWLQSMPINVYAYFEPRIYQAVNAGPLRFDKTRFCCSSNSQTAQDFSNNPIMLVHLEQLD